MTLPKGAYFELIKKPIIEGSVEVMLLDDKPSCIGLLVNFLKDRMLPAYWKEAGKIKYQASNIFYTKKNSTRDLFPFPSPSTYTHLKSIMY